MIPRRGFFGKLASLMGLSVLPAQASEESTERKLRREKMAAYGLGPDDVEITYEWIKQPDGLHVLRFYVCCHGTIYGRMVGIYPGTKPEVLSGFLVTRDEVISLPGLVVSMP